MKKLDFALNMFNEFWSDEPKWIKLSDDQKIRFAKNFVIAYERTKKNPSEDGLKTGESSF